MARTIQRQFLLNARATTGIDTNPYTKLPYMVVTPFDHLLITIASASSGNFSVKLKGGTLDTVTGAVPDFSAAQSATNRWSYVEMINKDDQTDVVKGSTGVVATGTDICKSYAVNSDVFDVIALDVTARSAGTVFHHK